MLNSLAIIFTTIFLLAYKAYPNDAEIKKSHLEDIFIWKMSDELKLTAKEEKQFTDINKALNKKKSELNKKIQDSVQNLNETSSEAYLKNHKKLLQEYNQVSIAEFDSIKKLLGNKKFVSYLKIKNELTTKVKSMLIGERSSEKKEFNAKLPSPKIIIEGKE